MSSTALKALELARSGDWEGAHTLVQDGSDSLSALIHGYLHREEGDLSNAAYWYRRAGETLPDNTLTEEWQRLYQRAQA
ncbi:hypothetical protein [Marinimicrobium sp. ARAG 43.8]|uniref:hypothetical protein n=1 Tax=Marinimicrobium sp. ARAG 43.8 TaxID=3418719 RepID=UPI003CE928BB